jgi:hypothetical protein
MADLPAAIPAGADLVLHVGAPKTGSSAAQRFFCTRTAALARHGIHYPAHPLDTNGVSGGHGDFVMLLLDGQTAAARRMLERHVAAARRTGHRLLLSAESAFAHAERIVPILPTPRFHIVCVVRHPLDALASHHDQGIKRHAGRGSLEQAAMVVLSGQVPNSSLSGAAALDWLRLVGRGRMTALPYVVNGAAIDAPARLAEALGVTLPAGGEGAINRRYTPAAARLKLLVNHLPEPVLVPLDAEIDRALQAYSDAHRDAAPGADELLTPATLAALEAHFRPDVERIEAELGITLEYRRTTGRRAAAVPEDDSLAAAWAHVRRTGTLGERLPAAVAVALRAESVPALEEIAGIIAAAAVTSPRDA